MQYSSVTFRTALIGVALSLSPMAASADTVTVCFSTPTLSTTSDGDSTSWGQISNATRYKCNSDTTYTLQQLAQKGYEIRNLQRTPYSSTTNLSTGTSVLKERYLITIEK